MERDRRDSIRYRNRRQRRRKFFLNLFLIVLLAAAAAALIVWKVFTVKTIVIEGNEHYTDKQIEKIILEDKYSWNSLYVLLKNRLFEVKDVPFVESIEVTLKNPHTLHVHVYEKGIIGYLYISAINQNAYFDTDGFVVETSKETIAGIPRVDGLDCDKVVLYEKLPIQDEDILKSLLSVTRQLRKNESVPLKIQYDKMGDISLDYGEVQVLLGGSDNLSQKILRVSHILPKLSGKKGVLHVENWTENTTNIIFDEIK